MNHASPLPGIRVDKTVLSGLKHGETLVRTDFPLLILAEGPPVLAQSVRKGQERGEGHPASKWLLSWCDSEELGEDVKSSRSRTRPISSYLALRVSDDRLAQFLDNHISLREVILHCEFGTFVYSARNPFDPIEVSEIEPRRLPEGYLPREDIALNGKDVFNLNQAEFEAPLKLGFHLISRGRDSSRLSWTTSGPFETHLQRYLSWAAHFLKRGRAPRVLTLTESDWTALNTRLAVSGSYKLFCTGNTEDPEESAHLADAFSQLKEVTELDSEKYSDSMRRLAQRVGIQATDDLYALLAFISTQGIAVSVRWELDGKGDELTLNKRVADQAITAVRRLRKESPSRATLTVTLSPEETAYLTRNVSGKGGWQSSLRKIQSRIKGGTLTLTADEVDQIVKQAQSYGQGGFQDRLQMVIRAIRRWELAFSGIQ